ncbi:YveK family protein [Halalkalibacterium halodurans]|jgi:capsular polysaccharide biosynthesis protein|uniref:YveK family protein n=2 Tax=Halalkalibacterium halodurans TaxID=86665 RepID=UPI0010682945|nr:YveK family protein [Halalkalibacterium halodurans]MDY7224142.1 YveK family protein [Halalkalibacterium halodurans]MDY7243427.1 YveK family protein [Halalkalibacterium halodurans]MED4081981.1 YveK family protein [Halalkalibacterium halodurans]MED4083637.1 YveK family protein [Halalkalibacterium halodurans]MED4106609.1 YveK family protein [Halalkalibacterium halodurans]
MEETISLKEMFHTIMRRLKLIIALPVLAVCLAGFVSFFLLTPIYQSSTQILVNHSNDNQSFNSQDIRTNIDLINTYSVIIKSPAILDKVIDNLQLEDTYSQLNERLQINSENNSQVVNITVKHEEPAMAVAIANEIALVFQNEIVEIMNVDNVSILSTAELGDSPSPVSPNPMLNMAIAFVVGLMGAVGIAFLLDYLDTTIKDEKEVEDVLELPVLGVIPNFEKSEEKKLIV